MHDAMLGVGNVRETRQADAESSAARMTVALAPQCLEVRAGTIAGSALEQDMQQQGLVAMRAGREPTVSSGIAIRPSSSKMDAIPAMSSTARSESSTCR